jgi:hypothetical protein
MIGPSFYFLLSLKSVEYGFQYESTKSHSDCDKGIVHSTTDILNDAKDE